MTRRLLVYSGITLVVVLLFIIVVRPILEARLTIVDYVVPQGYVGWLVVSWDCAGGQDFDDLNVDGNRYAVVFAGDGTACLTDPAPSPGYGIGGYHYPDDRDAPVRPGGVLNAARYYAATPASGGIGVVSTTGHIYNIASIGQGDEGSLGDRCDLERFLQARFGEPISGQPCGPIEDQVEIVPVQE